MNWRIEAAGGKVCGGYTDVVYVALFVLVDVTEDVVLGVAEDLHRYGVVVVLERRHVAVANS